MTPAKPTAKTASELLSLVQGNQLLELKDALSLLQSWGVRDQEYLPVLAALLAHEDPEVLRLTLSIMLSYEQSPVNEFMQLKEFLPAIEALVGTQFLAVDLIVRLRGPAQNLIPYVKTYLSRYREETCDLICLFGPLAYELVPDLIEIIEGSDEWDEIWAVVDALGTIGPAAQAAAPILKQLTKHRSGVITGSACVALESITGISRHKWPRGPSPA